MDFGMTDTIIKHSGDPAVHSFPVERGSRMSLRRQMSKPISPAVERKKRNGNDEARGSTELLITENDYAKNHRTILNLMKQANERLNVCVNNENIKKPHQVTVQLYVVFLRVGEIDNVKERFQADAYFEACWEDNTIDEKATFDPRQHWDPELFLENSVGNLKQDIKYKIERRDGKTFVYEMRMIKSIFWEKLELWDFPLDVQDLTITISSHRDQKEVKFEPSDYNESLINTEDFQQQQEWNLYPHISINKKYIYDVWSKHERPCFSVSANIARRPGYYIYNAYMLIFLITVLGFVPFSFTYLGPQFRIQTTLLLILSSINFRVIVTQKLPTVSYLTTLDKYAISALIFLAFLCIWHAIIGTTSNIFTAVQSKNPNFRYDLDKIFLLSIATLFLSFHLVYVLFFLVKFSRYSKLEIGDAEANEPAETTKQTNDQEPDVISDKLFQPIDINSDAYFEKQKSLFEEASRLTHPYQYQYQFQSRSVQSSPKAGQKNSVLSALVEQTPLPFSYNPSLINFQRVNNPFVQQQRYHSQSQTVVFKR